MEIQPRDWDAVWSKLSDKELDELAILRVMEISNGIIQMMFRSNHPGALDPDATRVAMKFSMGSIKRMTIDLGDEVIKFEGQYKEDLKGVRELYIQGVKHGNDAAYHELMRCSAATVRAFGKDKLYAAAAKLKLKASDVFPPHMIDEGVYYLMQFLDGSSPY